MQSAILVSKILLLTGLFAISGCKRQVASSLDAADASQSATQKMAYDERLVKLLPAYEFDQQDLTLPQLQTFLDEFNRNQQRNLMPDLARFLIKSYGPNFTIALNSDSPQGPNRIIFFGNTADLIITVNPHLESVEGLETVRDQNNWVKDVIPFEIIRSNQSKFVVNPRPSSCRTCHDLTLDDKEYNFTMFWNGYPRWEDMLGGDDDGVSDDNGIYDELAKDFSKVDGFQELFAPGKPYPYNSGGVRTGKNGPMERRLISMPNTRLTMLMLNKAAEYAVNYFNLKPQSENKNNLVKYLLNCDGKDQFKNDLKGKFNSKLILQPRRAGVVSFDGDLLIWTRTAALASNEAQSLLPTVSQNYMKKMKDPQLYESRIYTGLNKKFLGNVGLHTDLWHNSVREFCPDD